MDQVPEPWRPAQDLLVLNDREAEVSQNTLLLSFSSAMVQDGCLQTLFLPLHSARFPSTVLGLIFSASFTSTTFPHFSNPPSSFFSPYRFTFSLPNHRTSFLRLPTLHHPVHTPISLCLQTLPPPPPPVQALFASQCPSS